MIVLPIGPSLGTDPNEDQAWREALERMQAVRKRLGLDSSLDIGQAYSPSEPRDDHGRWTTGPGGGHAESDLDHALSLFEREFATAEHERAAILDAAGNVLLSKQGIANHVSLNASEAQRRTFRDCILIHNHPGDTPPSPTDFACAAWGDLRSVIAVSPHYRYTIRRPANGWPSTTDFFGSLASGLTAAHMLVRRRRQNVPTPQLRRMWLDRINAGLADTAQQYGIGYSRTERHP